MKTLISGAGGFIGRHLVSHILETSPNEKIYTIGLTPPSQPGIEHYPCDLSKNEALSEIITKIRPDRVYHLAGSSKVTPLTGMPEYFENNFLTTVSLFEALRKLDTEVALFFASSVHVYGNQEGMVSEASTVRPVGFYGFSKYLAEEALRQEIQTSKIRIVVGRIYSCIGPGQPEGFVASDLCRKIVLLPKTDGVLKTGPLSAYRRFLDVRDMVSLLPRLMDAKLPSRFEVFNIASPHELQIQQMVEKLLSLSGKKARLEVSQDTNANPFTGLKIDTDKLQNTLSPLSFRSLDQSLKDILDWAMKETA